MSAKKELFHVRDYFSEPGTLALFATGYGKGIPYHSESEGFPYGWGGVAQDHHGLGDSWSVCYNELLELSCRLFGSLLMLLNLITESDVHRF